jgi:hypothetical protein
MFLLHPQSSKYLLNHERIWCVNATDDEDDLPPSDDGSAPGSDEMSDPDGGGDDEEPEDEPDEEGDFPDDEPEGTVQTFKRALVHSFPSHRIMSS